MSDSKLPPGTTLRRAIREDIKNIPDGLKLAAFKIGVESVQTIRNYTCDSKRGLFGDGLVRKGTHSMNLDQFEELLEWTGGNLAAQAVAEAAGGVFVRLPDFDGVDSNDSILKASLRCAEASGAYAGVIREALKDEQISSSEWAKIRRAKTDMVNEAYMLAALCDQIRRE